MKQFKLIQFLILILISNYIRSANLDSLLIIDNNSDVIIYELEDSIHSVCWENLSGELEYPIDVNKDSVNDYYLSIYYSIGGSSTGHRVEYTIKIVSYGQNVIYSDTLIGTEYIRYGPGPNEVDSNSLSFLSIKKFNFNDTLLFFSEPVSQAVTLSQDITCGDLCDREVDFDTLRNAGDFYLCYKVIDPTIVYGWIKINIPFTCKVIIKEIAYTNNNSNGINALSKKRDYTIYPNPAKDKITISLDKKINFNQNKEIYAFDLLGKKTKLKYTLLDNKIHINIEQLPNGIYLIKIDNSNKGIKIIKS